MRQLRPDAVVFHNAQCVHFDAHFLWNCVFLRRLRTKPSLFLVQQNCRRLPADDLPVTDVSLTKYIKKRVLTDMNSRIDSDSLTR